MTTTTQEKLLPQNVEAEAGMLGSLLIDPEALPLVLEVAQPEDCYREAHRTIYRAAKDYYEREGEAPDFLTLCDELARLGRLEDIGGTAYVGSLANQVPTSRNATKYARAVRRTALLRRTIHEATQAVALAYHEADPRTVLESLLEKTVALLGEAEAKGTTRSLAQVLDDLAGDVLDRMDADGLPGLQTGFAALDEVVLGFEPGDLIYVAGRPGSAKSALGLKVALNAARQCARQGRGAVDIVTLEMSARAQGRRAVAGVAEINTRIMRSGFRTADGDVDEQAHRQFERAVRALAGEIGDRLYIRDEALSLAQLRAHVQRAVLERGCRLVVVDQLDLLSDQGDEFERVTKISRALKQIARRFGVVVLCLVQLSRKVEERQNKRPMLADLRQSGQLEQDADVVLGLYRPAYYDPQNADAHFQQFAELLVLKLRDGEANVMLPLRFEREYTRFTDWPFPMLPDDPTRGK